MSQRGKLFTFYALLMTQTLSFMGSRMSGLAIGIWIFTTTGEATPLALVSFFAFLPRLVSASIAGVLADRWDRRYVMAMADAGQAVGTVLLLVSFASGQFQLWHLYAVTLLQASFDIFQAPAFMASITMLVEDKHRNRANSAMLVTSPMAGILAASITGAAYGFLGVNGIIAFDLFTFAVSLVVVLSVSIPRPEISEEAQASRTSIWREAMAGFQFVWARKPLLMVFVFTASTNFFLAGMMTLQTPYLLLRTGSEATLGVLLGIFSAGSLAGSLIMATWGGTRPRIHTMMPGIALTGLALAFVGTQTVPLLLAAGLFVQALFPPMNNVCIISILQIKVPPDLQGRVFAAISQISMVLIPLSYVLVGPLADSVFEPLVGTAVWTPIGAIVGTTPGAGIGLMMVVSGAAIMLVSLGIYSISWVRSLETMLPDYAPSAA